MSSGNDNLYPCTFDDSEKYKSDDSDEMRYSPASPNHFYFLDDCRVAGIHIDWFGTTEEDKIEIYDALTGEIN